MRARKIQRYITPPHDFNHLHQRQRKSILFFFLGLFALIFLILHDPLQWYHYLFGIAIWWLIGYSNSYRLATLMTLGALGATLPNEDLRYVSLALFALSSFVGSVFIIGGVRRKIPYGVGLILGSSFYVDGCESGADGGDAV